MKLNEPKLDFLKTPDAAALGELLKNPLVQRGLEVALLQFMADLPRPDGLEVACRQDYELHGARNFMFTFLNLTEADTALPKPQTQNLAWQRQPQSQKKPLIRPRPNPPAP